MTIYCYLIGVRLEHAWVRRQLEGAQPYWVDCHLQSRVSKCCKQDWNQVLGRHIGQGRHFDGISPHDGRVLWRLSGQQWAQACPGNGSQESRLWTWILSLSICNTCLDLDHMLSFIEPLQSFALSKLEQRDLEKRERWKQGGNMASCFPDLNKLDDIISPLVEPTIQKDIGRPHCCRRGWCPGSPRILNGSALEQYLAKKIIVPDRTILIKFRLHCNIKISIIECSAPVVVLPQWNIFRSWTWFKRSDNHDL